MIQLLERFYDPSAGSISLAGKPITDYNIGWLRGRMGLISQEPVLFGDSIRYNIEYGRVESKPHWDLGVPIDAPPDFVATAANMEVPADVSQACRDANAEEFISQLKWGTGTHCGSKGSQLSGGQRREFSCLKRV